MRYSKLASLLLSSSYVDASALDLIVGDQLLSAGALNRAVTHVEHRLADLAHGPTPSPHLLLARLESALAPPDSETDEEPFSFNAEDFMPTQAQGGNAGSVWKTLPLGAFCLPVAERPGLYRAGLLGWFEASCEQGRGLTATQGSTGATNLLSTFVARVTSIVDEASLFDTSPPSLLQESCALLLRPPVEFRLVPTTPAEVAAEFKYTLAFNNPATRADAVLERAYVVAARRELTFLGALLADLSAPAHSLSALLDSALVTQPLLSIPALVMFDKALSRFPRALETGPDGRIVALLEALKAEKEAELATRELAADHARQALEEQRRSGAGPGGGGAAGASSAALAGVGLTPANAAKMTERFQANAMVRLVEGQLSTTPSPWEFLYALGRVGDLQAIVASCLAPRLLTMAPSLVRDCAVARGAFGPALQFLLPRHPLLPLVPEEDAVSLMPDDVLHFQLDELPEAALPPAVVAKLVKRALGTLTAGELSNMVEGAWAATHSLPMMTGKTPSTLPHGLHKLQRFLAPLLHVLGFDGTHPEHGLCQLCSRLEELLWVHDHSALAASKADSIILTCFRDMQQFYDQAALGGTEVALVPVCPEGSAGALSLAQFESITEDMVRARRAERLLGNLPPISAPHGTVVAGLGGGGGGARAATPAGSAAVTKAAQAAPASPAQTAQVAPATPVVLVPMANVVDGSRAGGASESPTSYKVGGVSFKRKPLELELARLGCPVGTYCMSYLLAGSTNHDFALSWVNTTFQAGPQDVVLPHPRWFLDKMAKPFIDLAASQALPKFFR